MEIKAVFGIASAIFTFLGLIPYFTEIEKGQINPHLLSWLGWAFITFIGGMAMLASGWTWAVGVVFANTLSCIFIVAISMSKKVGIWHTTMYDFLFFGLGILGIILWQTFNSPVLAVICSVSADFFFGIPTIIKTYKYPRTENRLAWLACSISGFLSILAVKNFTVSEFLYPLYLFTLDTIILLLALRTVNNKPILPKNNPQPSI